MKEILKNTANNLRMAAVSELAKWIVNIAPRTPEGVEWVTAIYEVSKRQLKREGVDVD